MITKDLQKKIELIKLTTRKKASGSFAGGYTTAFKGQGIEFEEVREYQFGDDVRTIDWNVTAKTGHPYIKRYVEERELNLIFAVDVSSSTKFKSCNRSKLEVAAEIVSVLAFVAISGNDRTGLVLWSDKIEEVVPPSKGQAHNLRLVRDMLAFSNTQSKTSVVELVEYLQKVLTKKSIIFIFSDFIDSSKNWLDKIKVLSLKHDVIAINIVDPMEHKLPNVGIIKVKDLETGEIKLLDTFSKNRRENFFKDQENFRNRLKKEFSKIGVDYLKLDSDKEWIDKINQLFFNRGMRR